MIGHRHASAQYLQKSGTEKVGPGQGSGVEGSKVSVSRRKEGFSEEEAETLRNQKQRLLLQNEEQERRNISRRVSAFRQCWRITWMIVTVVQT